MNLDGLKFELPDETKPEIKKIEKISPAKKLPNHETSQENLEQQNDQGRTTAEKLKTKEEERKKEEKIIKNEVEGKGRNLDIIT